MTTLPAPVARRLGVPEDVPLARVCEAKRPADVVQKGAVAALALEDIHVAHELAEVRPAGLPEPFARVVANQRVLVFPAGAFVLLDEAAPHRVDGDLLYVDTTARDVWLACSGADGLLVHARDGDVEGLALEGPSRLESLPPAEPAPRLGAPPIAAWVGDAPAPAWVAAATAELSASPDPLDHVAATGVVTRFWEAPDRATRRAALASLRAWLAPAAEAIVADALLVADRVLEQVTSLDEHDDDTAAAVARIVARERDRLESVRAALIAAGAAGMLDAALDAVDEAARDDDRLASLLEAEPAFDEDYARCVLDREPLAWWVG